MQELVLGALRLDRQRHGGQNEKAIETGPQSRVQSLVNFTGLGLFLGLVRAGRYPNSTQVGRYKRIKSGQGAGQTEVLKTCGRQAAGQETHIRGLLPSGPPRLSTLSLSRARRSGAWAQAPEVLTLLRGSLSGLTPA